MRHRCIPVHCSRFIQASVLQPVQEARSGQVGRTCPSKAAACLFKLLQHFLSHGLLPLPPSGLKINSSNAFREVISTKLGPALLWKKTSKKRCSANATWARKKSSRAWRGGRRPETRRQTATMHVEATALLCTKHPQVANFKYPTQPGTNLVCEQGLTMYVVSANQPFSKHMSFFEFSPTSNPPQTS